MFTSNKQISPPSLVLNCKVAKFCIKECPKAVNLKRISTQKECKCKEFSLQTRLGGEICSSDVIMHKGHWPIADRHVTSNGPRNDCGTHFGSSSLFVSKEGRGICRELLGVFAGLFMRSLKYYIVIIPYRSDSLFHGLYHMIDHKMFKTLFNSL